MMGHFVALIATLIGNRYLQYEQALDSKNIRFVLTELYETLQTPFVNTPPINVLSRSIVRLNEYFYIQKFFLIENVNKTRQRDNFKAVP